jgi:hypothetical protein
VCLYRAPKDSAGLAAIDNQVGTQKTAQYRQLDSEYLTVANNVNRYFSVFNLLSE